MENLLLEERKKKTQSVIRNDITKGHEIAKVITKYFNLDQPWWLGWLNRYRRIFDISYTQCTCISMPHRSICKSGRILFLAAVRVWHHMVVCRRLVRRSEILFVSVRKGKRYTCMWFGMEEKKKRQKNCLFCLVSVLLCLRWFICGVRIEYIYFALTWNECRF